MLPSASAICSRLVVSPGKARMRNSPKRVGNRAAASASSSHASAIGAPPGGRFYYLLTTSSLRPSFLESETSV